MQHSLVWFVRAREWLLYMLLVVGSMICADQFCWSSCIVYILDAELRAQVVGKRIELL